MTIVAGFRSSQGTILCADSYESLKGYYKQTVQKVHTHPIGHERILGVAAAGSSGLCDGLEAEILAAVRKHPLGNYEKSLKAAVLSFYKGTVWANPDPADHDLSALLVVHDEIDSALWRVSTTGTVTRHPEYVSVGVGQFVANQWHASLLPNGCADTPIDQLLAIAVCVLWHVKQGIDGCGGPTSATIFWPRGQFGGRLASTTLLSAAEMAFESMQRSYASLLATIARRPLLLGPMLERFEDGVRRVVAPGSGLFDRIETVLQQIGHPDAGSRTARAEQSLRRPIRGRTPQPPSQE